MVEATNGIQQLALMMTNPQIAAQQQKFALQQAMAQQMMQEGAQQEPTAQLANPGGQVIRNSPTAALARALQQSLGGYMAGKNISDQQAAYANMGQGQASQTPDDPNAPTMAEKLSGLLYGDKLATAGYEERTAAAKKLAETGGSFVNTPQGPVLGKALMGGNSPPPVSAPPVQPASQGPTDAQFNAAFPPQPPDVQAAANAAHGAPVDAPAAPVALQGATGEVPQVPLASDGKPLLPNITSIPKPDPTGTPSFKTQNTTTGVAQTQQDIKDSAEGNKAFAGEAQSLSQQGAQLNNLIDIYKNMQSGTLTMQNPELMNKLVGMGVITNPSEIHDIAGAQNATQNHILQIIGQIKDANANAGGGAATRTFGSEITNLLEKGESAKAQPEALWNVIGQAKGLVDHHLDMINGWQTAGGLGNRLAGGYTMRPDDYAQQFNLNHNIPDYTKAAQAKMGPFKGMAGNAGTPDISSYKTPEDIGTAYKAGKLTKQQATDALQKNHGFQ